MEVISINQLRVMLGDLAMNHKFVNDFFWGDIDSMRAWKGRIAQYPLVTAYSTAVQVNKTTKLITFNLEVSDKLYSDYDRNINEIESDTEQTIQDLFDGMRNFAQWKKIGVVQNDSFNATKFINQTGDTVAGWRASITLKLIKNQGLCLAPFEGFTPTPPIVCAPATVTNSNDTFFQSILSGASYVLPDSSIEVDGLVPFGLPATEPLLIKIEDQNGVFLVPTSRTVSASTLTILHEDKLYWILRFTEGFAHFKMLVTTENQGVFSSGVGTSVGTLEYSTNGTTYLPITFPFAPAIGNLWFRRTNYTTAGNYKFTGL